MQMPFRTFSFAIVSAFDLPRDFHPTLIRAAAVVVTLLGALFAMG